MRAPRPSSRSFSTPQVVLGEELTAFKAFTKEFPPELKGLAISNSDLLRKAHNSFTRPEPFLSEERVATKDDDVYHFISYLPVNGKLWELDGLKNGPVCLGDATEETWLDVVRPIIQKRIEAYSTKEIRFNLMAVIADRRIALQEQQVAIEKERNMTVGRRAAASCPPLPTSSGSPMSTLNRRQWARRTRAPDAPIRVTAEIQMESQKAEQWKVENRRRKHTCLIVNLSCRLRGELMPLLESAKQRKKAKSGSSS